MTGPGYFGEERYRDWVEAEEFFRTPCPKCQEYRCIGDCDFKGCGDCGADPCECQVTEEKQ